MVAKVEWHQGELFPRVGFIVANLNKRAKNVVKFYNGRGTAEQMSRPEQACAVPACMILSTPATVAGTARGLFRPTLLPASPGPSSYREALVADDATGEACQDWRQGDAALALT